MKNIRILLIPLLAASWCLFAAPAQAVPAKCHVVIFEGKATLAGACPEGAQVAVYTYRPGAPFDNGNNFEATLPQTLFSSGATEAALPTCGPVQADAFTGDVLPSITVDQQYRDRLIDAVHVNLGTCVEVTTTTATTTTSTTVPATTSTTPDSVLPSTVVKSVPPATLARTGKGQGGHAEFALGVIFIGVGIVLVGDERARRYRRAKARVRA